MTADVAMGNFDAGLVESALHNLYHKRYPGGQVSTQERFDFIIEWIASNA